MRKVGSIICIGFVLFSLRSLAQSGPPKLCKPCLVYAGDFDPNNPNSDIFWNEYTLSDPSSSRTYGSITVPKDRIVLIQGILFQTLFEGTDELDPTDIAWEIRTGDILDNGGTLLASGKGKTVVQPTGRGFGQGLEYTVAVKLEAPVQLTGGQSSFGTAYWFNILPECSNPQNPKCLSAVYYVTNTVSQVNCYHPQFQIDLPVINSPSHGFTWDTLCDLDFRGCFRISFGIMGNVVR